MTETVVATSQTSSGVIGKPELPANGKADLLIVMNNLWKTYDMGAEKVHALHGVGAIIWPLPVRPGRENRR